MSCDVSKRLRETNKYMREHNGNTTKTMSIPFLRVKLSIRLNADSSFSYKVEIR